MGSGTLLRADFFTESFDSGELVNVNIYMDDTLLLQTNFTWSGTEENYIALSSRQSTGFVADNLLIESILATVGVLESGEASLVIETVSGGYGVVIRRPDMPLGYVQNQAMAVEVVDSGGTASWVTAPYSDVIDLGGGVFACT